ncbi:MAG: phage/plasmid primase, P4 family, partial [Bacteroidota bacterium]
MPIMTTESRRGDLEVHDIANGNLFTEMYADTVLFDHSIRDWRIWEGGRWERDDRNQIQELAKITAYRIRDMAEDLGTKELQQRAAASLSMHGVRNMLLSAQSMPELSVTAAGLDANPLLFNVRNGTLELDTGVFREHRPGDRITMVAGCDYDPDADAPEFRRCLETYWPEPGGHDRDAREFLTRCMGYCLSGLNTEKLFMLLLGTGDTGKTTFMKAVEATWGDYFRTADWSTFAQQRDGDSNKHRTDLVRLAGARIVSASEGDEGCRMSDGILKRVTGRTNIIVRDLHSKPFSMPPSFKIFLDTNHFPWFNPLDQAMWNRIVQVYFRHVISLAAQQAFRKRYGDLDQVLASEASGILNLALEGTPVTAYDTGVARACASDPMLVSAPTTRMLHLPAIAPVLSGRAVRLEPLALEHLPRLTAVALADSSIFDDFLVP